MEEHSLPCILVIPCFNEASRLTPLPIKAFLGEHSRWQILFVDDGSSDDSAEILSTLCREEPDRIRLLTLERNYGKGEAVRRGVIESARLGAQYIGYWDADLATPLAVADDFAEVLNKQPLCVAVLGSRIRLLGRTVERSALRHYLGRMFATVASMILDLPVYDTQCGAKLFRATDSVVRAFELPFQSRWIFDVELIGRIADSYRDDQLASIHPIREFPLDSWTDVKGSKVRGRDFLRVTIDLIRLSRTRRNRSTSPVEIVPDA